MRSFKQEWFPFVFSQQSPALCCPHLLCPFQSHFSSDKPMRIPEPSPTLSGPNTPLPLASNDAGNDAIHVTGDPRAMSISVFLSFLQGQSYKPFHSSCHDLAFMEWKQHFLPGDLNIKSRLWNSRCQKWSETQVREETGRNNSDGKHSPRQHIIWTFTQARQASAEAMSRSLPSSSFIQYKFTEHLLCARCCGGPQG